MVKYAKDLTDKEQGLFIEEFYGSIGLDDLEDSDPWGCPWHYNPDALLKGDTIEEMAQNYLEEVRLRFVETLDLYDEVERKELMEDFWLYDYLDKNTKE